MTNPHNLYNILAAFNAATRPVEAATPKQQAKMINERANATVPGRVASQLNEAIDWDDMGSGGRKSNTIDTDTGRIHRAGPGGYGNQYDDEAPIALPPGQIARGRGRPKNLAGELKRQAAADRAIANQGVKQGRGRPRKAVGEPNSAPSGTLGLHNFLFGKMPDTLPGKPGTRHRISDKSTDDFDEFDEAIDWNDMGSGGRKSNTIDTDTGRIHRAGPGGYGNQYDDEAPMALPPGQIARGRGRPKNLAGELKRQAAADRAIANQGIKQGRGRPKKMTGAPVGDTHGTLGLHNFLFGKMPDTLPGKPGTKHKISDKSTDDFDESMYENTRRTGTNRRLSESVDTLAHIKQRFKHEVKNFQAGDDLDNDLYEALFDYYSDAGEIPYGVAKGRTGDPYQWVASRFEQDNPAMDEGMGGYDDQFAESQYTARSRDDQSLNELAKLAGITNESMSVIGGDYTMDQENESKMDISTNQSSNGKKSVNVSAEGDAATALLSMLKMAGMGGSDAAHEQEVIISLQGDGHMGDDECDDIEMEEDYSNEPSPSYQSIDSMMSRGDDMNREKKQNFPLRAAGNNPMSEAELSKGTLGSYAKKENADRSVDRVTKESSAPSMGRDLMAEYRAMKIRK